MHAQNHIPPQMEHMIQMINDDIPSVTLGTIDGNSFSSSNVINVSPSENDDTINI